MSRIKPEHNPSAQPRRVEWISVVALVLIYGTCLVNAGIALDFTRGVKGPRPDSLEQRYSDFRELLDGEARIAYVSDRTVWFVGARFALVPTILDISFVDYRLEDNSITGYDLQAMVNASISDPPLVVLCEFSSGKTFDGFLDELSAAAIERGIQLEVTHRAGSRGLLTVGG